MPMSKENKPLPRFERGTCASLEVGFMPFRLITLHQSSYESAALLRFA